MKVAAMHKQHACKRHGGSFETSPLARFGEVSLVPAPFDNGEKRAFVHHGTTHAITNSNLGVAANLPLRIGRGGARNRADRESDALTAAQVANLRAAFFHALKRGLPFNRMITIHWEAAGVPLFGMAKATGRFTDLLAKMLRRHGCETSWLWVHENGERKGGHCHLLAHVPAEHVKRLSRLQKGWLRCISDRPYRKRVIHSKPIGGRLGLESANSALHAVNAEAALAYILKGANPMAAVQFGLERLEMGGRIIGKRCGTSQNIGANARRLKE